MHGLLLINKPQHITSNQTIQKIKKKFKLKKISHCGILDPIASGILIACIERQTNLTKHLQNKKKRYLAYAINGIKSTTHDIDGKISFFDENNIISDKKNIKKHIKTIKKTTNQIPPIFSSIKHNGIQFYKYARLDINIKPKHRYIKITKLKIIKISKTHMLLDITCSKGTYIREIINDIGKKLNCTLCIYHIIRLAIGNYNILDSYTLKNILKLKTHEELEKILIQPLN